ncbi:sensor histidine kinase [Actinokineospora globicatena]|uniref:sensor histidine kinase n=1 Tax=Actinokineospora globicatena TaxID=103729 RepID=UPI0020A39685|nr:sensor histidine kinase [Actinokineospora globicatena]MCP2304484.1 Anti-sigma regulatory factor (Ser/Thr protein kinase) [Actinokineospora globicatena]GLW78150.1 anti-sigma regulatory factor [Actinokineospora globicatena]GLW85184.1 anti-sigma regulatory factor [Actinokineospora globicatena]
MTAENVTAAAAHTALLYRGTAEYLAAVLPFVRDGVAVGDAVTVAAPAANLAVLRAAGIAEGFADQVRWLDMEEVGGNPGRIVPAVLHPVLDRPARVVTEVVWPRRPSAQYQSCVRHEALANRLLDGRTLRLLCPYDAAALDHSVLADALVTHPGVLDQAGYRASDAYAPEAALVGHDQAPAPTKARSLLVGVGELGAARALVSTEARAHGLAEQRVGDVALVITELVTNSIEHGGGQATLSVWAVDGELVCQVRDGGKLADPLAGLRPAPVDQAHGRGLLLVHTLADLVTIHATGDGTVVRAHFTRSTGA